MRLSFLALLLFFCASLKAQGDMRFFGTTTKDHKPLSGATVTVLMDGKQIYQVTTGRNGKFHFTIDINHNYKITFSAPGCVDMFMTLNLNTPPDKSWIYPDYAAEIPFFSPNDPKVKTDLFAQKPFIKVIFDGDKGFYDDPSYKFSGEILKDPMEEQRRQEELARKQAREKARLDSIEKAEQAERDRLAQEEAAKEKAAEEAAKKQVVVTPGKQQPVVSQPPPEDTSMETDAIALEKEKQEKLVQEKQNKNIRAEYENNLLKLVAESERQANMQHFNKMKTEAQNNSVVEVMRREAERKAQSDFLTEQKKEKAKQVLANKQVQQEQIKRLVVVAAHVERDDKASKMKPVAADGTLNYNPSPNIVVTTDDGMLSNTKTTVITWPGGKRKIYRMVEYWWGSTYYYRDETEIDEKTYNAEIAKYKHS